MPLVSKAFGDIITFTRASTATYFDATGTLQSAAINTPRFDYDPATLAARGFLIEEARTNSIRNNTMVDAVASVARNIGTISSVSRSASATVVVAATGHTVSLGDVITVSGATPSVYNGTYSVSAVVANVSYSYVVASSATDSASGYAVSVMSPGTLPTNWSGATTVSGLTREVVGTGTENGITYVDVKYSGTTTAALSNSSLISFEPANQVAASLGQTWTHAFYVKVAAGSMSGITDFRIRISETDGTTILSNGSSSVIPTTAALATQRYSHTRTTVSAGITHVQPMLSITAPISTAIDITLRIGLPQLEGGLGGSVNSGTASGTTTAVVLSAGSATDDIYNGNSLFVNGEYRVITDYVGSTKTATVSPALSVSPSGGYTVFAVGNAAFATSVIPTSGSALTRAADVASVNTLSPWFSATEGTLYFEAQFYNAPNVAISNMGALSDGTNSNRVTVSSSTSFSGNINSNVSSGGVGQANPYVGSLSTVGPHKAAATYANNSFNIAVNGTLGVEDTSGVVPVGVDRLILGRAANGAGATNGWLRRATYYPRKLSSAELQTITA